MKNKSLNSLPHYTVHSQPFGFAYDGSMCVRVCEIFFQLISTQRERALYWYLLFLDFIYSILQFCTIFFFFFPFSLSLSLALSRTLSLAVCFEISFTVKLGTSSSYTIFLFFRINCIYFFLSYTRLLQYYYLLFFFHCFSFFLFRITCTFYPTQSIDVVVVHMFCS